MLTDSALRQIMPRIPADKFEIYLLFLNRVMQDFQIDTPLRASAFLAQLAHESGQLRFMEEIWGPTPQQRRYEPPSDLARRLGNTQPGDGKRFKGRGPIQITGRANYKRYGDLLGVDLITNPDLAATPQTGFQIAATFWRSNGLNELADVQDFIAITRRINGGLNGLADRQKFYDIARSVLGVGGQPVVASTRPRTVSRSFSMTGGVAPADAADDDAPAPANRLPRGWEAIADDAGTGEATRPSGESKKKSAGASARPAKKPVRKKRVTQAAPSTRKTMNQSKTQKKAAVKAAKKATTKKAARKKVIRIILIKTGAAAGKAAAKKAAAKNAAVKSASRKAAPKKAAKKTAKKATKKTVKRSR
jgi:predicted chitinase